MRVAILGASNKPERYSHKALRRLLEYGHEPFPVHPALSSIDGITVYPSLDEVPRPIHTLTLYVNAEGSSKVAEAIVRLAPRRVIFNPGTENPELRGRLESLGISTMEACTLVMLGTGQFLPKDEH